MIELTKSQKKKVRALIELGLMRDYVAGIKGAKAVCDSFIEGKSEPKEYYLKLYSTIADKDRDIGRRYNDLRGSQYFIRLLMLLREGVLLNEEIHELDEELKERIFFILREN
ncbi:MAG: hypothetical protein V1799_06245 [bacterium]